jgi:hypothetical protein
MELLTAKLKAGEREHKEHLSHALNLVRSQGDEIDDLKGKIAAAKTTWLVAGLRDGLARGYKLPPSCPDFSVIATDGSQINIDRHRSTRCYLINIGGIILRYGETPDAHLVSQPALYFGDEELAIADPSGRGQEIPIEGALLGVKRSTEECRLLAQWAMELEGDSPVIALLDGSLILWGLAGQAYPDFATEALLHQGFLKSLDRLRELTKTRRLALASYISFPRSADVVNALRVALCPHETVDCDRHCSGKPSRECDAVSGVRDRELFENLLNPGERSSLFISRSSVVQKHYGAHEVHFFYLKTDDEIARVEVPRWVADAPELLELVHCLVLDQCQRGRGYPIALSEAHEKAVVTGADQEQFWQLLEETLSGEGLPFQTSSKSTSKRTRWV